MSTNKEPTPELRLVEDFPEGTQFEKIPQPPEHLFGYLGNLPDIDPSFQLKSFWRLADIYGPIYYLNAVNRKFVVVSTYDLAHQVQDDDTTEKMVLGAQIALRPLLGNGLFTSDNADPAWGKAHRLLVPVFGPLGVKKMFPNMLDIASQMILKWDRAGPENLIYCADDFTRLAFDTIAICSFDYRFNSFYANNVPEFASRMSDALSEAQRRSNRTQIENKLRVFAAAKLDEDIEFMKKTADDIVEDRINNPRPEINDLLNVMLSATDPVTGEKMDKENIRQNMITFLVAGHETTSGTLGFLFHLFTKNPDKMLKAQQEVDKVLGDEAITIKHIPQLEYVFACIKETLRLNGPIGGNFRRPKKDIVLSGKYRINSDTGIMLNYRSLHRDPKIWGDDPHDFRPERWFEGERPQDCWKPFGVGMRSCIGRYFADQEIILNVALILQRFVVTAADPSYNLVLKSTLTIKPDNFAIKVARRPGKSMMVGLSGGAGASGSSEVHHDSSNSNGSVKAKSKLIVAYGSNAGTCKTLAEDLQASAPEHGFEAEIKDLDAITEHVPEQTPVVVIAASYEGKPTDNAKTFMSWLELVDKSKTDAFNKTQFAVFGVGNTEWVNTYQKIPKAIRASFLAHGAKEICEPMLSDVKVNVSGDWETWTSTLWASLEGAGHAGTADHKSSLTATVLRHNAPGSLGGDGSGPGSEDKSWGVVTSIRSLGGQAVGPEKREIAIQLPEGVAYDTGDYISVAPFNHPDMVTRALARFDLHPDDQVSVANTRKVFLAATPDAAPVTASQLFAQKVELGTPATQKQLELLAAHASDEGDATAIRALAAPDAYLPEVIRKCRSVLDVLADHPNVHLPLALYLDMLKPLAPRQYSISSSPLDPTCRSDDHHGPIATLTYDVHTGPAASNPASRVFYGVASSYMARLQVGSRIHCAERATNAAFHLPADPSVPVVFIAAGTGLAPMRGFVQERAALATARGAHALGPAILYFGCRDHEADNLYADELERAQALGAVSVRRAFSRRGPEGEGKGFRYVDEIIRHDADEIAGLWQHGAKFFVCGSAAKLAKSAATALKDVYRQRFPDRSDEQVDEWLESVRETRYVTDVYD